MYSNPINEGIKTFAALRGLDMQEQQLAMQQQERSDKRAALQFEQDRTTASDQRATELHTLNVNNVKRGIEKDATKGVLHAYNAAKDSGQSEIDISTFRPDQQKFLEGMGKVNVKLKPDGTESRTISMADFTPDVAKEISPIFKGKSPEEIGVITKSLGTVKAHLDQLTADMGANPQKYANGVRITREQSPELFTAFNGALASQVNKGLDGVVAKKEVVGAVVNPDGTVSVEVESFGKDGRSLGRAPATYGRANGDPNSVVMTIPSESLYRYVDVNEQFGRQLESHLVSLGDDTPLKDQKEKRDKSQGALKLRELAKTEDSPQVKRALDTAALLLESDIAKDGASAITAGAKLREEKEKTPKHEWRGVKGIPGAEQLYIDNKPVPASEGGIKLPKPEKSDKDDKDESSRREAGEKLYGKYLEAREYLTKLRANMGKEVTTTDPMSDTKTTVTVSHSNIRAVEDYINGLEKTGIKSHGWKPDPSSPNHPKYKGNNDKAASAPALKAPQKQQVSATTKPKASDFWRE